MANASLAGWLPVGLGQGATVAKQSVHPGTCIRVDVERRAIERQVASDADLIAGADLCAKGVIKNTALGNRKIASNRKRANRAIGTRVQMCAATDNDIAADRAIASQRRAAVDIDVTRHRGVGSAAVAHHQRTSLHRCVAGVRVGAVERFLAIRQNHAAAAANHASKRIVRVGQGQRLRTQIDGTRTTAPVTQRLDRGSVGRATDVEVCLVQDIIRIGNAASAGERQCAVVDCCYAGVAIGTGQSLRTAEQCNVACAADSAT